MIKNHPVVKAFVTGRFSFLLSSLAVLFFISPLVPGDQPFVDKVFGIFTLAVLASCLRAIARTRRFFVFMLVFTLLNVAVGSVEILSDMEPAAFKSVVLVVRLAYFVVIFFSIMRYVLDGSSVTGDKICGAISAYMLMGVAWSFVYSLFYLNDPSCLVVPEHLLSTETVNSTWTMYFSFTTLSTLGYGDIVPRHPAVQSYAIMEAACGQIFLAVIVARLIALHITHERDAK
jgi:voltage-gated potassium channel